MHKDPGAPILCKETRGNYCLLRLKSPLIAREARPGQFVMVRVRSQPYPLLRRPFSIHARAKDAIDIFFARTGVGTEILAEKRAGETLDLIGPLGKGFLGAGRAAGPGHGEQPEKPPPAECAEENLGGKQVFLVGGGRGIAPLYFLAEELRAQEAIPIIFYGGKTKNDLPLLGKLKTRKFDVLASTDDGSFGFHGFASALLEAELARIADLPLLEPPGNASSAQVRRLLTRPSPEAISSRAGFPACIYACGPDPMMARIAALAASYGIPARFSLESIMGCGIGACWGCVRKIKRAGKTERVKICEEGPVFESSEIVWDSNEDWR